MGVIKQGILGGFANKVGSVIGTSWKGIAVMKARPLSVANPRTAAQVQNRDRFSFATKLFSEINAEIVKPLWDRFSSKMSGFNAIVQYNLPFMTGGGFVAPENILISNGKMASTPQTSTVADVSFGTIAIDWTDDSGVGLKLSTDSAFIVAINQSNNEITGLATVSHRDDESAFMPLPAGWSAGHIIYCYLAFRRFDGTVVSVSSYATTTIVA